MAGSDHTVNLHSIWAGQELYRKGNSKEMFYKKEKKEIESIRKKYNIDKKKFVVLGAGQIQNRKGVLDFVEVAKNYLILNLFGLEDFLLVVLQMDIMILKKLWKIHLKMLNF